jgi:hypothetical protein
MEACESRVNNLLASLSNLPDKDVKGKFDVLIEIIEAQGKETELLKTEVEKLKAQAEWIPEILASDGTKTFKATSFEMFQSQGTHTRFRASGHKNQRIESLQLKGEV